MTFNLKYPYYIVMIGDGLRTNIIFIEWAMFFIFLNELVFSYELFKIKEL